VYVRESPDTPPRLLYAASVAEGGGGGGGTDPRAAAVEFVCGTKARPVDKAQFVDKLKRTKPQDLPAGCGVLDLSMTQPKSLQPKTLEPKTLFAAGTTDTETDPSSVDSATGQVDSPSGQGDSATDQVDSPTGQGDYTVQRYRWMVSTRIGGGQHCVQVVAHVI
jgi:hypothetical protein